MPGVLGLKYFQPLAHAQLSANAGTKNIAAAENSIDWIFIV